MEEVGTLSSSLWSLINSSYDGDLLIMVEFWEFEK